MRYPSASQAGQANHRLLFRSISPCGSDCSFPCDAAGHVDLDTLGDRALEDFLYARAVIGGEYCRPRVEPLPLAP